MTKINHIATIQWPFRIPGIGFGWFSQSRQAFVAGNEDDKWIFPVSHPDRSISLIHHDPPYQIRYKAYDAALADQDYDELGEIDGFRFLSKSQYDLFYPDKPWGSICPLDQALASGLMNDLTVLHPYSQAILSFAYKSICLYQITNARGEKLAVKKVGSRQNITALCAHPGLSILYYGTSEGEVFELSVTSSELGKQIRKYRFERVVGSIQVLQNGRQVIIGGLGFLTQFSMQNQELSEICRVQLACRSTKVIRDQVLIVNQGINGFSIFNINPDGLELAASTRTSNPVGHLLVSPDGIYMLAISKPLQTLSFYQVDY